MDPVTVIITALAAGAVDVVKPTATEVVKDSYQGLKDALVRKFGGSSEVVKAAKNVETRPDSEARQSVLKEELTAVESELGDIPQMAEALLQALQASGSISSEAHLAGDGTIVQGEGNVVAGRGGVAVGGNVVGGIQMGSTISGDYIGGDKVLGSEIGKQINTKIDEAVFTSGGDNIKVGDISGSSGVAIGRGASAKVSTTQQSQDAYVDYDAMFERLEKIVKEQDPSLLGKMNDLQSQVALGAGANDKVVAGLIDDLTKELPDTKTAILVLFHNPDVSIAAGDLTQFVLGRL